MTAFAVAAVAANFPRLSGIPPGATHKHWPAMKLGFLHFAVLRDPPRSYYLTVQAHPLWHGRIEFPELVVLRMATKKKK